MMTDDRYLELAGMQITLLLQDPAASREPLRNTIGRLTSMRDQNLTAWRDNPADGRSFHRGTLADHLRKAATALVDGNTPRAVHHLAVGADHIGK